MKLSKIFSLVLLMVLMGVSANAATITDYSNSPAFQTAIGGPGTLETFTSNSHFPISTGVLNSSTNLPSIGITPGMIQPGVTYSTPVGSSYFFNIDAGGGFTGGFLDGFYGGDPGRKLTVTFNTPVAGFGFDTNSLMGNTFGITINFSSGSPYTQSYTVPGSGSSFFGFVSNGAGIESAVIGGQGNPGFAFALDNFQFGGTPSAVPIPGALLLFGPGLVGLAAVRRRFKK
jgi:hypothetical protein